jgi:peptidyl-prolyl cis-trans isomerase B (cyclophilin B)
LNKITLALFTALLCLSPSAWADVSHPRVRLETNLGAIVLELDAQKAPKTVENFLTYVRDGFYDGTTFHRVIKGFMIQGGGLTADMQRKPPKAPIKNEADNGLKNKRGTIAMARTGDPNSATSQFFINTVDNAPLDYKEKSLPGWGYCVFGKVVEGMDVVDAIEAVKTGSKAGRRNVPTKPVVIKRATVMEQVVLQ